MAAVLSEVLFGGWYTHTNSEVWKDKATQPNFFQREKWALSSVIGTHNTTWSRRIRAPPTELPITSLWHNARGKSDFYHDVSRQDLITAHMAWSLPPSQLSYCLPPSHDTPHTHITIFPYFYMYVTNAGKALHPASWFPTGLHPLTLVHYTCALPKFCLVSLSDIFPVHN